MKETSKENIGELIQNYQKTNRTLVSRSILMCVFFIIFLGIQHSITRNKEKRKGLNKIIWSLEKIAESNNVKETLQSLKFDILWDYYRVATEAEIAKLDFDLSKSDYKDKTPVYDLMEYYDKQLTDLGLTSKDYQISVLGISTSFSDWFYFAPLILLLLYHDMTRNILYRKSLRDKLTSLSIEPWKLGSETFGADHEQDPKPISKFMFIVTNSFIAIFVFLPIIPVLISAFSYISENRESDISTFMVIIQWICPIVMIIEMIVIYSSENLLGMKRIVAWVGERSGRKPTKLDIVFNCSVTFFLTALFTYISYHFKSFPSLDIPLMFTVLINTSILPIACILLYSNAIKLWYKSMRVVGRLMISYWLINFFLWAYGGFFNPGYPREFWLTTSYFFLGISILFALLIGWIFSKEKNSRSKV